MTFKGHIRTHICTEVAEHDSPNFHLPQADYSHTLSPQQTPADPKDPPVEAGTVQRFPLKNKIIPYPFPPELEPRRAACASCPVGPARHPCSSAWPQPLHGSTHVLTCGGWHRQSTCSEVNPRNSPAALTMWVANVKTSWSRSGFRDFRYWFCLRSTQQNNNNNKKIGDHFCYRTSMAGQPCT